MEERIVIYDCEENDNQLRLYIDEHGEIEDIEVGCIYDLRSGYSVIGIKDLKNAFEKVGMKIDKI